MLLKLKSFFYPRKVKVEIIQRDPFRLTVEDWRADEERCKSARRALEDPTVRLMLDALRNSHLSKFAAIGTIEQRAFHLSRCEGYGAALNNFELLGVFAKPTEPLDATFEEEENDN